MNCRGFRHLLVDFEISPVPAQALEHAGHCPACAALADRRDQLRSGLLRLASQQAESTAPPRLEAMLLHEFRAQAASVRNPELLKPHRGRPAAFPVPVGILSAGALAAAIAALLLWIHPPASRSLPTTATATVSNLSDDGDPDSSFIPLPYFGDPGLAPEPAAEGDIVRVEMPRSALVALGVLVPEDGGGEAVEADLLLGAGGMPQAVRIVE